MSSTERALRWRPFWPEGIGARSGYRAEQTPEQRFGQRMAVATIERPSADARWNGFVHVYPTPEAVVPCKVARSVLGATLAEARAQAEALLRLTVRSLDREGVVSCAG